MKYPTPQADALLGTRLRELRMAAGMSQHQLARTLGWHHPTIVEIEMGRRSLRAVELVAIAEALDITIAAILEPLCKAEVPS